jgi:hypothetical protein
MHNLPHLVVSISGHGFGHVAQTAPILNRLHERMPQLRITVRSTVPAEHLGSRIHAPFTHLPGESDIGMVMSSALDVRVLESCAAYREFHTKWNERIAVEATMLRELKADFVFSNVGYLPLAGAQRAGIPNAALCSLNWADIYRHYCGDASDSVRADPSTAPARGTPINPPPLRSDPSTGSGGTVDVLSDDPSAGLARTAYETIAAQIHDCYANADAFLRATPGMSMTSLPNLISVSPIAAIGTNRRAELNQRLKLSTDEKLVLISLGGIASRLPVEEWPRIDGVRWLVQQSWQVDHPDAIILETLQTKNFCPGTRMSFSDLLASSDALICKPGYGSFVEAACSGVPVLYVSRADWPESPALIAWLQQHGLCREVSRQALEQGRIAEVLEEIWNAPRPDPVIPEGGEQVANWLAERLNL